MGVHSDLFDLLSFNRFECCHSFHCFSLLFTLSRGCELYRAKTQFRFHGRDTVRVSVFHGSGHSFPRSNTPILKHTSINM